MDLNEALNRGIGMLGNDDVATLALAGRIAERLPDGMTATVGVPEGVFAITVTAPLVMEDVWTATVRARITPGGTLEVLIDDDIQESTPSPNSPDEMAQLVTETVGWLRLFHGRDRSRYCTGVVNEHDGFDHYAVEGNCPIHPNADLLEA